MIINEETAVYKEQLIEEYKNNPLIEALPNINSSVQVIKSLANYPYYNPEENELEKHIRLHIVQRVFQFFQPLPRHLELEQSIARIIRQGYISRNPLKKEYIEKLNNGYREIRYGAIADYVYNTTASSITIVGVSGMGKTTFIEKVLKTYPQVINHTEYKDEKVCFKQVTYLKLDCPYDGSLKALCLDFFSKVDDLLGSNYFTKYYNSRLSANAMLPIIKQIAMNINLGVLVVDEIQHLSTARSGGSDKMLNFFVTLINTVSIPVILIGTPKALPLFQNEFRQARRSCGQGNMFWDRLDNNEEFFILVDGMWEYQWVKKPQKLTREIVDVIYEESQGIIDVVLKLFFMAQVKAISTNKETIDTKLIRKVAKENFKMIKPMLNVLKNGKVNELDNFDDIMPFNIDSFIEKEQKSLEVNKKLEELKKIKSDIKEKNLNNLKEQVVIKLLELGYKVSEFNSYLDGVLSLDETNVNKLVRIIIDLMTGDINKNIKVTKANKKIFKEDDIRAIAKKAKDEEKSVYDKFKEVGYIKKLDRLLQEGD